jgi:hypothetical protein
MEVVLRQPTGAEDLLLQEASVGSTELTLALVGRLTQPVWASALDWRMLSVTDLEAVLLKIRQSVFGDLIQADLLCTAQGCGARVDVSFRVGEYLAHHRPRTARGLKPAEETGWFQFLNEDIRFRLPSAADQAMVAGKPQPESELMRRCVQPERISWRLRKRVENAMEVLAPSLSHDVQGECPDCHATFSIYFDVQDYVLSELRNQAACVYEDVHLLALHYKWSEESILALPRIRRLHYATTLRQERGAA